MIENRKIVKMLKKNLEIIEMMRNCKQKSDKNLKILKTFKNWKKFIETLMFHNLITKG